MFETIILIIIGAILFDFLLNKATQSSDDAEDEQEVTATFEVELEDINGVWYCWIKDHREGYSFVGQSPDKDELEQQFVEYAKRKYSLS